MNVVIATDETRRNNSRAIERRDRWRQRYAATATCIRRTKERLALAHRFGNPGLEREELQILEALKLRAYILMLEREEIGQDLRDTAYRWAPKEALA